MTSRTFVVAVRDPDSGRLALQRAALLAAPEDRIVLAHVPGTGVLELLGLGAIRAAPVDAGDAERLDWLDELAKEAPTPRRNVECVVLDGRAAAAICALATERDAALIVVGAQRPGAFREFAFGSTALHILRGAPCPVLVARAPATAAYGAALACAAPDVSGTRVVEATRQLVPDAALTVLCAYRAPSEGQLRARGTGEADLAKLRDEARQAAQAALAGLQATAPLATLDLREGHAATAILEAVAQHKPDVAAVARHRGSAVEEHVLGSVTQFVLYNVTCDLLLVP